MHLPIIKNEKDWNFWNSGIYEGRNIVRKNFSGNIDPELNITLVNVRSRFFSR